MKSSVIDRLAVASAAGIPRRRVFKYLAGGLVGAAALRLPGGEAQGQELVKQNVVSLRIGMPGGKHVLLRTADRYPARVWVAADQPKYSFVPQIIDSPDRADAIELSAYHEKDFLGRMMVPVSRPKNPNDAKQVPLTMPQLKGWTVSALWARTVMAPALPAPEDDCTVDCCNGPGGSAPAVCCDPSQPECGKCCDPGHCPPCC